MPIHAVQLLGTGTAAKSRLRLIRQAVVERPLLAHCGRPGRRLRLIAIRPSGCSVGSLSYASRWTNFRNLRETRHSRNLTKRIFRCVACLSVTPVCAAGGMRIILCRNCSIRPQRRVSRFRDGEYGEGHAWACGPTAYFRNGNVLAPIAAIAVIHALSTVSVLEAEANCPHILITPWSLLSQPRAEWHTKVATVNGFGRLREASSGIAIRAAGRPQS